jgi:glycerol-3-phosphate dehydrogenase
MLAALASERRPWDIVVIGGGATGLGVAADAASRGYRTVLLEAEDFAQGTSSRSTKLIHGGVRYLQQGNVGLVLEALRERGLLTRNAPHLVAHLAFVVPNYVWWEAPFYGVGLRIYDLLAGRLGLGPSRRLTRDETLAHLPTIEPEGLKGGVVYYDGQFDDARLAVTLARTAADLGAVVANHMPVVKLVKSLDLVRGVVARDKEAGTEFELAAKVVVNATGAFSDHLRRMDDPGSADIIAPSQGVHLVLDRSFLPGECAIMVPRTDDGRVLFCIPWLGRVLVGTTDTPLDAVVAEPCPLAEEIDFLLEHAARYLTKDPTRADVLSAFAGIRPLVKASDAQGSASVPRDHSVLVSKSGLVTVAGGKWTTYRKMAEDTVAQAAWVAGLDERPCVTESLRLHGWRRRSVRPDHRRAYGTDAPHVRALARSNPEWSRRLHRRLPYTAAEVLWAVRHEMARTVEDVLSRRTRALILDARASLEAAPVVAEILAAELGNDPAWQRRQVTAFRALAARYLV